MQSVTFRLFKLCSVVLIWLGICVVASAQDNNKAYFSAAQVAEGRIIRQTRETCIQEKKKSAAECDRDFNAAMVAIGGNPLPTSDDPCIKATEAMKKSVTEFSTAASAAGAGSNMYDDAAKCQDCMSSKTDSLPSYCSEEGRDLDKAAKRSSHASSTKKKDDLPISSLKLPATNTAVFSCPAVATSILEKLESKLEKLDKKIEKQRDDKLSDEEKLQKLQSKMREAAAEYKDKQKKINREKDKAHKELKSSEKKEGEELQKQLQDIQDQITQVQTIMIPTAMEKKRQKIAEANDVCEGKAYEALGKYLKERGDAIAANQLSPGSFLKLANTAGSSRKNKNAYIVWQNYKDCKDGTRYFEDIKRIENEFKIEMNGYDLALEKSQSLVATIQTKLGQLNGPEYQEKYTEINTLANEALEKAYSEYNNLITDLNTEMAALQKKMDEEKLMAKEDIANKRLMTALLARAEANSTADPTDSKAKATFLAKFPAAMSSGDGVYESCSCESLGDMPSTDCKEALRLICSTKNGTDPKCTGVRPMFSSETFRDEYLKKGKRTK